MLLSLLVLIAQATTSLADVPATIEGHLGIRQITAVEVSADGRSVAFVAEGADLDADHHRNALYAWEPRTGIQPLAPSFSDVRAPQWSRDGTQLLMVRYRSSRGSDTRRDIVVRNLRTEVEVVLDSGQEVFCRCPSWSPDEKWAAFHVAMTLAIPPCYWLPSGRGWIGVVAACAFAVLGLVISARGIWRAERLEKRFLGILCANRQVAR